MLIKIERNDGEVSLINVHVTKATADYAIYYPKRKAPTDQELAQFEFDKSEGVIGVDAVAKNRHSAWSIIDPSVLPADRSFRAAWGHDLKVNMPKARGIHMEAIRLARDIKLLELDIETLRGINVQTEKQVLRDLPANVDLNSATTPDELKAIWPVELGDK